MKIKYKVEYCSNEQCKVSVNIAGFGKTEFQDAGSICFKPQEWLLFSAAQLIASESTKGHIEVSFEDSLYAKWAESLENEIE